MELIKTPRKNKRRDGGPKKYVLCSRWDPRQPNVKLMEDLNKENLEVFPRSSIIAGFRRQKNIGEIIAPLRWRGVVDLVQPPGPVHYMSQGPYKQ